MPNKISKRIASGLTTAGLLLAIGLIKAPTVLAETIIDRMQQGITDIDLPSAGTDVETASQLIVGKVLNTFLSVFGILFLVLIIYGGYKWMMASGREDEVQKAKDTMRAATIGLIIVLSAYAISYFVAQALQSATTAK
ncbi:MAG: hypothetical protein PHW95_01930 [Patescibacteria group bacterium]|nr:hypothetical protein [Patescibacteria group bacterium]